jgi:hypothetical protein
MAGNTTTKKSESAAFACPPTLAIFPAIPLRVNFHPNSFSENEDVNVNISRTTVVPSAELLEAKVVSMDPWENAVQQDEVPVVVGYEDEDDEDEEYEEDEEEDDLDEDEDEEDENDEELDDDGLDYDWEEVDEEEDDDEEYEEDEEDE